jgi:hypothetical protein
MLYSTQDGVRSQTHKSVFIFPRGARKHRNASPRSKLNIDIALLKERKQIREKISIPRYGSEFLKIVILCE